jgi:hypothetical protein
MKNIVVVLLLFIGVSAASAQEVYSSSGKPGYYKKTRNHSTHGYDPSRLIVGGGLNAGLSDGGANAGISPLIGYRFTDQFSAGVGFGYQYYKFVSYVDQNYNSYYSTDNIIYPSIWGRFFVWRNIFIDATFEYDFIFQKDPVDGTPGSPNYGNLVPTTSTYTAPCLLLGAGLKIPIAGRVSLFAEIMYDILQQPNSPYLDQLVPRAGICAGL